ncbi:hypothetical protein BCR36DRAFT_342459 [Piromyces finnis]|uniref:BZIP domain-containing protein n=1 Tax=Piromyces finnis TaxID=1754191 RepID=A0A1Y1VN98_9FUNG|nr:hypothetical protein BCR36DRAFT_342459 [Piromyces finnis]|eukprot:ORX60102.1 hypothetical protein BCR36DRAFT_342459 [Piromyces finnis]
MKMSNNNSNNTNNLNNNKFFLSNGNNYNNGNDKQQEQIINYLNNTSNYYGNNDNTTNSVNTASSSILDTTSYQRNNNNNHTVNNNSIYINSNNNIEDHELDLWLREFTMDNFPLNVNNVSNTGNNNDNHNNNQLNTSDNTATQIKLRKTINSIRNNTIENQFNTQGDLINNEETAAQDKFLKIRKLKNIAIEDRAKKNGQMDNYTQNLQLISQSLNLVNNNSNSNTFNNKSFIPESSSPKFTVSSPLEIYKTNSSYPYTEGYKSIPQLSQFLMNDNINNENSQQHHSYTPNEILINKKDNIFNSFNVVSSPKDIPFSNDSSNYSNSLSRSSDYESNRTSSGKGKEVLVEEKLNDKRKRNNAASARFRAKKKLKEQMTDLTAKEMTQKAQNLEIKVKEMELEIKWLRSLVTKNVESKTLKEVYEENGYLFVNENDGSQNSVNRGSQKLISISDSVRSYSKCCCNIDKSKGGTCGKNGTIGHCKCGGIGYCLMNININKNKKIIKPKVASNQYPLISKDPI